MWMGIVTDEFEVLVLEVEETLHVRIDLHCGQRTRLTGELEFGLFDMIQVEVGVASGVDEVASLIARHLCHHLEQQGVRGDIKRYSEEGICTALVELERETVTRHIELEDGVTGRQGHLIHLRHIPGRDNHTTGVGVVLQLIQHVLDLVDGTSLIVRPRTPLVSIDGAEFTVLISPLVPDTHPMFLQVFHVGVTFQKPQQFVDDTLQVEFFRGQQGESVVEVVTTLGTEDADGTSTRAVTFLGAFCQDAVEDV